MTNSNPSQCRRVLARLRRIWELRQRGWQIVNRLDRDGLRKRSWYRLEGIEVAQ